MPIDYKKYPPNWAKEIVPRILTRAKHRCEHCGIENRIYGYRDKSGKFVSMEGFRQKIGKKSAVIIDEKVFWLYSFLPNKYKLIQIILTIAHLDHDAQNWEVSDDRLAALCQACHLKYDLHRHVWKRKFGLGVFNQPTLF